MPEALSLTHHTFLVGPWPEAPAGSVLVTQLDDEDAVVLILKPEDVPRLIDALAHAAAPCANPECRDGWIPTLIGLPPVPCPSCSVPNPGEPT